MQKRFPRVKEYIDLRCGKCTIACHCFPDTGADCRTSSGKDKRNLQNNLLYVICGIGYGRISRLPLAV